MAIAATPVSPYRSVDIHGRALPMTAEEIHNGMPRAIRALDEVAEMGDEDEQRETLEALMKSIDEEPLSAAGGSADAAGLPRQSYVRPMSSIRESGSTRNIPPLVRGPADARRPERASCSRHSPTSLPLNGPGLGQADEVLDVLIVLPFPFSSPDRPPARFLASNSSMRS